MVYIGIGLIIPSVPLLALAMVGVVDADLFVVGGNSGLRTIAAVAILGCLMAAVGYWGD